MSTFKLSGREGIKNWGVSTNISLHFEKHLGYELGNTDIEWKTNRNSYAIYGWCHFQRPRVT